MSQTQLTRELRRRTRVPLKVPITAQSLSEPLTCDGETVVLPFVLSPIVVVLTLPLVLQLASEVSLVPAW
jgi:hypothetical protein